MTEERTGIQDVTRYTVIHCFVTKEDRHCLSLQLGNTAKIDCSGCVVTDLHPVRHSFTFHYFKVCSLTRAAYSHGLTTQIKLTQLTHSWNQNDTTTRKSNTACVWVVRSLIVSSFELTRGNEQTQGRDENDGEGHGCHF